MWLALDTATDRASVALGASGAAALEENLAGARRHAAELLPIVEALLRRASVSLDDVTGLVLSDGPGSFTGLRVGATVAKALVRTRGLPLWTAPSLLVRAAGVAAGGTVAAGAPIVAVANALRGEVFAAAYAFRGAEVVTLVPPSVWEPEALVRSGVAPAVVVGEAPPELQAIFEQWSGRPLIGPPEGAPHAARLIDLVGRAGGAVRVDDVARWEPVYGRPAEAQVRWEKTHGRPLSSATGGAG